MQRQSCTILCFCLRDNGLERSSYCYDAQADTNFQYVQLYVQQTLCMYNEHVFTRRLPTSSVMLIKYITFEEYLKKITPGFLLGVLFIRLPHSGYLGFRTEDGWVNMILWAHFLVMAARFTFQITFYLSSCILGRFPDFLEGAATSLIIHHKLLNCHMSSLTCTVLMIVMLSNFIILFLVGFVTSRRHVILDLETWLQFCNLSFIPLTMHGVKCTWVHLQTGTTTVLTVFLR